MYIYTFPKDSESIYFFLDVTYIQYCGNHIVVWVYDKMFTCNYLFPYLFEDPPTVGQWSKGNPALHFDPRPSVGRIGDINSKMVLFTSAN